MQCQTPECLWHSSQGEHEHSCCYACSCHPQAAQVRTWRTCTLPIQVLRQRCFVQLRLQLGPAVPPRMQDMVAAQSRCLWACSYRAGPPRARIGKSYFMMGCDDILCCASRQVMSASHVSGGFWLQVPSELCIHFEHVKHDITLLCDAHPPDAQHNQEDGIWLVGWLPKTDKAGKLTGGVGLSKNWRGFALDQVSHLKCSLSKPWHSTGCLQRNADMTRGGQEYAA